MSFCLSWCFKKGDNLCMNHFVWHTFSYCHVFLCGIILEWWAYVCVWTSDKGCMQTFVEVLRGAPCIFQVHACLVCLPVATFFRAWTRECILRATDKVHIFVPVMPISSPNPMFDHLLESSLRDDSHKWSAIGFSEETTWVVSFKVNFTYLTWSSVFWWDLVQECGYCM